MPSTTPPGRRSSWRWSAPTDLRNAVTLNSVLVNAARAIGPAVAGTLIATIGVGVCFLVNAGTFAAVIVALATSNRSRAAPLAAGTSRAWPAA